MEVTLKDKTGTRNFGSDLEAREEMYKVVQGSQITRKLIGLAVPDRTSKTQTSYERRIVKEPLNLEGSTIYADREVRIPIYPQPNSDGEAEPETAYNPRIESIKSGPEIFIEEMQYEGGKIRIFAVGEKVHSVVFGSKEVKCYSRNLEEDEDLETALVNEEIKWSDRIYAYEMIKNGKALGVYSPVFPEFKLQYVENKAYQKEGKVILSQNLLNSQKYHERESATRYASHAENEIDMDMNRWRQIKRRRAVKKAIEFTQLAKKIENAEETITASGFY